MLARYNGSHVLESQSILDILKLITYDSWVVLDIDNTVMEAQLELGSDQWFTKLMEHACQLTPNDTSVAITSVIAIYQAVQHHIRTKPVEPQVVQLIKTLQDIGIPVFALTARDGTLIETTFRQLDEIGIDFSRNLTIHYPAIQIGNNERNTALFQGNIVFCGGNDKGQCLKALLGKCKVFPRHILMVDDKEKHLAHVKEAVLGLGVHFNGLRYGFLDNKVKMIDMKQAHLQLIHLKNKLPNHIQTIIEGMDLHREIDANNAPKDVGFLAEDPLKKSNKRKRAEIIPIEKKSLQRSFSDLSFFYKKNYSFFNLDINEEKKYISSNKK